MANNLVLLSKDLFNKGLHSLIVQVSGFSDVTNIYFDLSDSLMVLDAKIVPIAVSFCIRIASDETIILSWLHTNRKV